MLHPVQLALMHYQTQPQLFKFVEAATLNAVRVIQVVHVAHAIQAFI